jgi:hypothetical protein
LKINAIFGTWIIVNANGWQLNEKMDLHGMWIYNDTAWKI